MAGSPPLSLILHTCDPSPEGKEQAPGALVDWWGEGGRSSGQGRVRYKLLQRSSTQLPESIHQEQSFRIQLESMKHETPRGHQLTHFLSAGAQRAGSDCDLEASVKLVPNLPSVSGFVFKANVL